MTNTHLHHRCRFTFIVARTAKGGHADRRKSRLHGLIKYTKEHLESTTNKKRKPLHSYWRLFDLSESTFILVYFTFRHRSRLSWPPLTFFVSGEPNSGTCQHQNQ